uniref:Hemerythrin-like domain-containing protein n=1 Tax=Timspurckia oligopyrenoides TaxID=708627 RepID=A0A7S0ZLC7_9RHOD|mmetsp:Transcript_9678/g.17439  ORF Transcript_9678/g.17439 Transcript_9678/m.17439 type:complete len:640 (+) Transcript_9678:109-2028(+)|eukprot:CAMPEP_0182441128 /NCGR_PEP_ID=MMETSP1172-20130603/78_1 /TAXON_ID=708627 /ORGANISM="Timspurckia oligopyrenoides, Strain CCMP3278" /LENGTH=639 /DNA_ID=CAMNT_0024635285 /DNA_START=98 /DNA_END=2017 /DNA_ORIENTATION=+
MEVDGDDLKYSTSGATHPFSWEPCGALVVGNWEGGSRMQCVAHWEHLVNLQVHLDRPLTWDSERNEWRWHKTWRMPEITIRVAGTSAFSGSGTSLEVRLSVVCAGNQTNELIDVGIIGPDGSPLNASLPVVDGECRFSRLRLIGTSNTHGGKRFHLTVSLLARRLGSTQADLRVIGSLISSGFSVYSRKDADKKRKKGFGRDGADEDNEEFAYEAFAPELFTKEFVKKVSDHNGSTTREPIDNSWIGLTRYFQAPNIRFKSRHPLLLAARFSNVVAIVRDAIKYPTEDERTYRALFCSCGFPTSCTLSECDSCAWKQNARLSSDRDVLPPWIMVFINSQEIPQEAFRWLSDHMVCVKSLCFGFLPDVSALPQNYAPICDMKAMTELYCRVYALEFASKGISNNGLSTVNTATPPVKMEYRNTVVLDDSDNERMDSRQDFDGEKNVDATEALTKNPVKAGFAEYYIGLHSDLRSLLNSFLDAASNVVAEPEGAVVSGLQNVYFEFTEALAIHSFVEDTILFPELTKRVPGVAEAYNYDHFKQSDHLTRMYETLAVVDENNAAELFLQISGFAAIHQEHMEKEEEHLLPYFLSVFSDQELLDLIRRSSAASASNALSQPDNMWTLPGSSSVKTDPQKILQF